VPIVFCSWCPLPSFPTSPGGSASGCSRAGRVTYPAFWGVLLDLIMELLGLIIKPFDNQPKISPLMIKLFEIFDYQSSLLIISFSKRLLTNQTRQTKATE
jgi:hypothetical protein